MDLSGQSGIGGTGFDICYWLDKGDVIVDIAPGWESFAEENQADGLERRRILGRSLLSFIHGDSTRMYVRTLIQSARLLRQPLLRLYRCDSPDLRRYMEMRLSVDANGLLRWEHRLLRCEPLGRRLAFVPFTGGPASRPVVRCSVCNRIKAAGHWQEPDAAVTAGGPGEHIAVIYGVCPDCLAAPLLRRVPQR